MHTLLTLTVLPLVPGLLSGLFNALGLTSNNQPQQSQGTKDLDALMAELAKALFPSAQQEAANYQQRLPQRMSALDQAYTSLSPMNQQGAAEAYGNRTRAAADRSATSFLTSNPGFSSGAAQGIRLDAANRGQSAANDFYSKIYDPSYKANAFQQQASVYSPGNMLGAYGMASGALGNAQNAYAQGDQFNAANRQPSPLESILGIAGQAAPYFFGSGGGGGGYSQMPNPFMGSGGYWGR